jgi:hypothetical protein
LAIKNYTLKQDYWMSPNEQAVKKTDHWPNGLKFPMLLLKNHPRLRVMYLIGYPA